MKLIFFLGFIAFISKTNTVELSQCIAPLGMESGTIPDEDISASSSFDGKNVGPQHGRMRNELNGGAWCPKNQVTKEPKEWIEINLENVHLITATGTQGRFGNGQGVEFAEAYILEYWRPSIGKWHRYRDYKGRDIIVGNINTYLEVKYELNPSIWASKIRFYPFSYYKRTVCMRVEIYGCFWNDGIVSYSMPQGDKRNGYEFFDVTYDGYWDEELKNGLGLLTDGKFGPDNYKDGYYDYGLAWVGWKNDSREDKPIEIKFEFDTVREFTHVHIFCNNQFTRDIEVFEEARIWFSIGGKYYYGDPIIYTYMQDRILESPRNVSIRLYHHVGRFVKIQLHFASKWIMVSEVMFDSVAAEGVFESETMPPPPQIIHKLPTQKNNNNHHIKQNKHESEIPITTVKFKDSIFMTIIIGILMAIIFLLALIIFIIINRHKKRKCFTSSLTPKSCMETNQFYSTECTTNSNYNKSYMSYEMASVRNCLEPEYISVDKQAMMVRRNSIDTNNMVDVDADESSGNEYQEPYQTIKFIPNRNYNNTLLDCKNTIPNNIYSVAEESTRNMKGKERIFKGFLQNIYERKCYRKL